MCLETPESAGADDWLASWYAEQEGALADLLERLEQERPSLDALLAEAEQDTRALLADLAADVCPCCGQPLPKADQKPTRSAQNRGKSGVKAG
jgi:DNA repair exonuclease SbcCD ATPase subunit